MTILFILWHEIFLTPPEKQSIQNLMEQVDLDVSMVLIILLTHYLTGRHHVPKQGNLHIAWDYAQNPADHHQFISLLCVTPAIFNIILTLIEDHPIFVNNSNNIQAPVESQLAVTLYHMGRYGNAASIEEVAWIAGCSEGLVKYYTHHCFTAIEALHDLFVQQLSPAEKEVEKEWVDTQVGFCGTWREGWIMYDRTIIILYKKPGLNGDAYYTRKGD